MNLEFWNKLKNNVVNLKKDQFLRDLALVIEGIKSLLKRAMTNTFNAITVDSDTSTNDMVAIFSSNKVKTGKIYNVLDPKLKDFEIIEGIHVYRLKRTIPVFLRQIDKITTRIFLFNPVLVLYILYKFKLYIYLNFIHLL